ncbi:MULTISPECIES: DUF2922 family protein [Peptoniphilus]|uniref:DUF2922 family protein n=1 Tax=Peptoniphilus TaxID=162289 RepID=UPI0003B82A4A|nr:MULTISPECIES: DUF2922 family protein [Peptoniphilus]ERT63701.1 PF11148 family protein [Peptoniphilus sp. BV3AC2]MDK8277097.1 DUF2922 family protein [Peptoniphilus duerdenii]
MITKRSVRFRLKDETAKVFSVTFDNPKEDIKQADIAAFNSFVMENDIFRPYGAKVASLVGAELVTVTRTDIK